MRNTSSTLLIAVLLALGFATTLQAQTWRYRVPRYDSDDRVAELAQELETEAAAMRSQFERNNRRPTAMEARALADLRRLEDRAANFHVQVETALDETGYSRDDLLRDDFLTLRRAFYSAADSLRLIRPRGYVDQSMDRILELVSDINRYYGYPD